MAHFSRHPIRSKRAHWRLQRCSINPHLEKGEHLYASSDERNVQVVSSVSSSGRGVIQGVPLDSSITYSPELADRNVRARVVLFYECTRLGALVVSCAFMNTSMVATIEAKEVAGVTSTSTQGNGCKNAVAQSVEAITRFFDVWMVLEAQGIGVEPATNIFNSCPCQPCKVVVERVNKLLLVNAEPSGHPFPTPTQLLQASHLVQREIAVRVYHLCHEKRPRNIGTFNDFGGIKVLD